MSVYTDDIPPGVFRIRVRGAFNLNQAPHGTVEGWDYFLVNDDTADCFDSCNEGYRQLHGNRPTPESDRRFDEIMLARLARP